MSNRVTPPAATPAIDGGPKIRQAPLPVRKLFGDEERRAVLALLDGAAAEGSHVMGYNGEQEKAYCDAFAAQMGGGYADGVNSGSTALFVALSALELPHLSEVVVPPITDPGGVMPVAMAGCVPVAADASPHGFNVGPREVEAVLTPRTRAIVLAHITGIPIDVDPIVEMARTRGIAVVEDCAQAHGARSRGRLVGTLGDIAAFSTMFGKHHASGGQGGFVYTRREDLYWKARRYADRGKPFGLEGVSGNVVRSLNFNMDELHAAIGRVNLGKLSGFVARRRGFVARLARHLAGLKSVTLWSERPGDEASYWFVCMRYHPEATTLDRGAFARAVTAEGVPLDAGYPFFPVRMPWATDRCPVCGRTEACTLEGCARKHAASTVLPNASAFEAAVLRVGIHEGWGETEADDLGAALAKIEAAYRR